MGAKVSSVTVTITETDIMANIREFVDVEGLKVNNVEFKDKSIEIRGSYKKVIEVPFLFRIRVEDVHNNKIRIIIEKIQALKIGVPNGILMTLLNLLSKKLKPFGVSINGNEIIVDADVLLEKVDHVHLMIDNILMENGVLAVKISAISADVKAMQAEKKAQEEYETSGQKEIDEIYQEEKEKEEKRTYNAQLASISKPVDDYQAIRDDLSKKVPAEYNIFFEYAAAIPDIAALAFRVIKDRRVLPKDKLIIGLSCGYFLSPIDIFPDKVPFIGKMDDLALFGFGVYHLLTRIPYPIVVEHWSGDIKTLKLIKVNLDRLSQMSGAAPINKIFGLIEKPLNEKFGSYKDDEFYMKSANIATFNPQSAGIEEDLILSPDGVIS